MPDVPNKTLTVAIVLFQDCDLLDVGGPYEVFLTASRLAERVGDIRPFDVETISIDGEPVRAYGGLGLVPTATADRLDDADLVVIPGAIDLDGALTNNDLLEALSRLVDGDAVVASVCTGAFLLGAVSALDGRPWTTHWEDIDLLSERIEGGATHGVRWVDDGQIVTGGALSSGIAMSLHLVARLASEDLAERTARQLDYDWTNVSLVSP